MIGSVIGIRGGCTTACHLSRARVSKSLLGRLLAQKLTTGNLETEIRGDYQGARGAQIRSGPQANSSANIASNSSCRSFQGLLVESDLFPSESGLHLRRWRPASLPCSPSPWPRSPILPPLCMFAMRRMHP